MYNFKYEIEPKTYTFEGVYIKIMIQIQLNESAIIQYGITNDKETMPLSIGSLTMQGADYDAWGNDDNYVIEWVCNQLGLTLKNQ